MMPGSLASDPLVRLNIALATTLTAWVSSTIRHGWNAEPIVHNGTLPDILAKSQVGRFTCGTASRLLILVAEALGFRAREVLLIRQGCEDLKPDDPLTAMNRHRVVEIDCARRMNEDREARPAWIVCDPTLNAFFSDQDGRYCRALDLHQAHYARDRARLQMVQGQPPVPPVGPAYGQRGRLWTKTLSREEVAEHYNQVFTLEGCLVYYHHFIVLGSRSWPARPIQYVAPGHQALERYEGRPLQELLGDYLIQSDEGCLYHDD
ncbi:hypothetical protein HY523_00850 [Candidatus Berkelbacteria bacterium]|nr:hypothetical protein [Candidatus Berkelbacteria bacterium]